MAELYNTITKLPLSIFQDCLVDGNLSALIISGEVTNEEIELAWVKIQEEYSNAMGDEEMRFYWLLYKEVTILAANFNLVNDWVYILSHFYHKEIADDLNNILKTKFEFTEENRAHELERCLNRAKELQVRYEMKSLQLKALADKNNSETVKVTREYFQSMMNALSDHAKFDIPETITVYKFCDRIKRFNKYIQQAKNGK